MLKWPIRLASEMYLKIIETDPDLDPLRDDPRFKKLVQRERGPFKPEPSQTSKASPASGARPRS